jgi:hypothetical protein
LLLKSVRASELLLDIDLWLALFEALPFSAMCWIHRLGESAEASLVPVKEQIYHSMEHESKKWN